MEFVDALPNGDSRLPALHVLGWAASWMAAPEALEPSAFLNGEAETLAREVGDRRTLAWALDGLGQCRYFQGDFARARPFLLEARDLFEELGDWLGYGHVLWVQGCVAFRQGQFEVARELFATVIEGQGTKNTPQGLPFVLESLAYLAISVTQPHRAAKLLAFAQVVREGARSVQQPLVRAEYEAQIAELKTQIEPDELEIVWQQGREMSRDEAIQFALRRS
jgi:tetratricopeptide (TPR) repeat protein